MFLPLKYQNIRGEIVIIVLKPSLICLIIFSSLIDEQVRVPHFHFAEYAECESFRSNVTYLYIYLV